MKYNASYIRMLFQPDELRNIIYSMERSIKTLRDFGIEFDALAFRGQSGAGVAYPLSFASGIPIVCVRKQNENAHGYNREGPDHVDIMRYLIVDDFVQSGDTVRYILRALQESRCVGMLYYNRDYTTREVVGINGMNVLTWNTWKMNAGEYEASLRERLRQLNQWANALPPA